MKNVSIAVISFFSIFFSCSRGDTTDFADKALIETFDSSLRHNILKIWYPRVIDLADGGYLSNFSYNWEMDDVQDKMIVSQSRHIWTSSQAAMFYSDSSYTRYAKHGFDFLKKHMWDNVYGGFFSLRAKNGSSPDKLYRNQKMAYGNAFAIYGLVSYYNLSKDTCALNLAKKTFNWLEAHSYDQINGGYVDPMNQDGTWAGDANTPSGIKDYNSTIHILEAFTELYKVWPDPLVRARLQSLLTLVRDTFVSPEGYLHLYFTANWKHISNRDSGEQVIRKKKGIDHISFGHDVETAFLMLEASYALGKDNDTTTLAIARKMVDHSLATGFDSEYGGFFGEGYYMPGEDSVTILEKKAQWWVQAEGLNALLLMSEIFPQEKKYREGFLKTWKYIDTYLIDKDNGGWYIEGLNYSPHARKSDKATIWKVNYHNSRALMNCIMLLKNENEVAEHFRKIGL